MPDQAYVAAALAVAVTITVALRAIPFGMRKVLRESGLLADIGRWMPLGAITVLAIYCLAEIDVTAASHGIPEIAGVVVTVGVHAWRRNTVLSIVTGTLTCLVLANHVVVS